MTTEANQEKNRLQLLEKSLAILKNPITGILMGAIIAFVFFIASYKTIEPRYAISTPELLAETTKDAPRLKLFWDDQEIRNIKSMKVVIWNAGRQHLDKNNISTTNPIRLVYPENVHVLFYDFSITSREDLRLQIKQSSEYSNSLEIIIEGDEALEADDGGLLNILYTGETNDYFYVDGRIKGSKEGFKRIDWNDIKSDKQWSAPIVVLLASLVLIASSISNLRKELRKRDIVKAVFSVAMILAFSVAGIAVIYQISSQLMFHLAWLP